MHIINSFKAVNRFDSRGVILTELFKRDARILCLRRLGLNMLDPLVVILQFTHLLHSSTVIVI